MKVLFTGASSFTGCWFVQELAATGHQVTAIFRHGRDDYEGVRKERVDQVTRHCEPVFNCSFGDATFFETIRAGSWDLLCHHAADVTNYKSPDFDVNAALANNSREIGRVLEELKTQGCRRLVLTGSVFECNEGVGEGELQAFSPYGLSKALTAEVVRYHANRVGMRLGKFVIPNPFGPQEEPRFTAYLVRSWRDGKTPCVNTPDYVRDNIHISLLAKAYVGFCESLSAEPGFARANPSGYAEPQGAFTERFATAMEKRLGIACAFELGRQTDFFEPLCRVNSEPAAEQFENWSEESAWDELASYYRAVYLPDSQA
jgi:UDP-glucose 4-epimerase